MQTDSYGIPTARALVEKAIDKVKANVPGAAQDPGLMQLANSLDPLNGLDALGLLMDFYPIVDAVDPDQQNVPVQAAAMLACLYADEPMDAWDTSGWLEDSEMRERVDEPQGLHTALALATNGEYQPYDNEY